MQGLLTKKKDCPSFVPEITTWQNSFGTYRMEGLDLPIQKTVFLDWRVAVHGPNEAIRVFTRLMRLFAKHGWCRPPVNLDVSPIERIVLCICEK